MRIISQIVKKGQRQGTLQLWVRSNLKCLKVKMIQEKSSHRKVLIKKMKKTWIVKVKRKRGMQKILD